MAHTVVAIDLGASSGRVLRGVFEKDQLKIEECARFNNGPVLVPAEDNEDYEWDVLALWTGIRQGLAEAARRGPVDAIGIDSWAVDYGLVDEQGRLVGNPASYRSERTGQAVYRVFESITPEELYCANGLQLQSFNTMFQMIADREQHRASQAKHLLLIPDLFGYWLTQRMTCEVTNASTTGLIDPFTRQWSNPVTELLRDKFNIDALALLPELSEAGTVIGPVRLSDIELKTQNGDPTPLIAVGSHDTASAVVAVPAKVDRDLNTFGFISSGTWSLVGMELTEPVLTTQSCSANFTNELGVDGTVRYLKNIMGMWVQQECLRQWRLQGMTDLSWQVLDAETESAEQMRTLFDINDPVFMTPGNMLDRIRQWCQTVGEPIPLNRAHYLRAITESLVVAYQRALREASVLSGRTINAIHIVGGGSRNTLLCQSTADATGIPVIAGPVEGTAIGNMAVQLRAIGAITGNLDALRCMVAQSCELVRYEPRVTERSLWDEAEKRVFNR